MTETATALLESEVNRFLGQRFVRSMKTGGNQSEGFTVAPALKYAPRHPDHVTVEYEPGTWLRGYLSPESLLRKVSHVLDAYQRNLSTRYEVVRCDPGIESGCQFLLIREKKVQA